MAELPSEPTKTGFAFDGWYVDSEYNQLFDETQLIVQNTTLYAKYAGGVAGETTKKGKITVGAKIAL